ncbi:carbohydrate-binding WSC, partial [Polyplosphaeria fusca]
WKYLGCYSDNVAARVLHKAFFASDVSMRGQICISFCDDNGYTFAGTEWSRECFCGLELPSAAVSYPDDCTMECTGSDGESCGGSNRLTVYSKGPPDPQTDVGGSSYTYLGCYTDIVSERTLPYLADVPGGSGAMTVSACTGTCYSLGYTIGGLEFAGVECWCGNTIPASSSIVLGSSFASGCDMLCRGNRSEFCGGPDRLNLY